MSREELIRRAWDLAEFDLVTDPQSPLHNAIPSESYQGLGDLDTLAETDHTHAPEVTYIPYRRPGPSHPPPVSAQLESQPDRLPKPLSYTYDSAYEKVAAILGGATDRVVSSLADLGLALAGRDAADRHGDTPHPRLVSTVQESDVSFRPRPELWEVLQDSPKSIEDPMGDWPTRLLHIPSMTSLEWKAGNRYGDHQEPRYAVLSYTWGRWELRCEHEPPCAALGVRGVDWGIPAVCPRLFTVDMFEEVLASVAARARLDFIWLDVACIDQRPGSAEKAREIGRQARVFGRAEKAFIWLLDPRPSSPVPCCGTSLMCGDGCLVPAELEKWRTRETFKRSAQPAGSSNQPQKWHSSDDIVDPHFVFRRLQMTSQALERAHQEWLSQHASGRAKPVQQQQQQQHSSSEDLHNAATAAGAIASLTSVPWFSSTWTLQEAFIQPTAEFLDREGRIPLSDEGAPFSLRDLLACCRRIHRLYSASAQPLAGRGDRNEHIVMKRASVLAIERTGLQALADRDRMTLYACAQLRHARSRNDWVYGIMQVWGFQLGEAAGSPRGGGDDEQAGSAPREWTLEDLETELGRALLRDFPVESQLQVHAAAPEGRQSWRVSARSTTPLHPLSFTASGHLSGKVDRGSTELGVRRAGHIVYGYFRGRSCAFESLHQAWTSAAATAGHKVSSGSGMMDASPNDNGGGASPFRLSLDHTNVLNSSDLMLPYSLRDVPNEKQLEVADTISAVFRRLGRSVSVLHLATVTQPHATAGVDQTMAIGLIVMNCPDRTVGGWRKRLGVCLWDANLPCSGSDPGEWREAHDILSLTSSAWGEDECIFG